MNRGDKPAFPDPSRGGESNIGNQDPLGMPAGITIREYFAAMAMQGLLANSNLHRHGRFEIDKCIQTCMLAADELLKQLEQ